MTVNAKFTLIFCSLSPVRRVYTVTLLDCKPGGGGGGQHPILAHRERLRPKGLPFLGCRYTDERVGTLLVEVYERAEKSVIWLCERAQRANTWILRLYKVKKTFYFRD